MKKILLLCFSSIATLIINAQTPVNDSVSLGANFTKMSFYSMAGGESANVNAKDWDLQFGTSLMDAAIRVNDGAGVMLFRLQNADTANWMTADTSGMTPLYNSDTSWNIGAFNVLSTGQFDYGWGGYDMVSHNVTGTKVFVVQTINGNYKKVLVKSLVAGDMYEIWMANLDNSSDTSFTLKKSDYPGKTSFYYAIDAAAVKDIEPVKTAWDIVFRRFNTFLNPPGINYTVSGALLHPDVTAAEARSVSTLATNYQSYSFESNMSVIGYDWKGMASNIIDSLVYFVSAQDAEVYRLVFTAFGGMATGDIHFSKTKLVMQTAISEVSNVQALTAYPNPSTENIKAMFTLQKEADVVINITDLSGKSHLTMQALARKGLNVLTLQTADLAQGFYLLTVDDGISKLNYKFVRN